MMSYKSDMTRMMLYDIHSTSCIPDLLLNKEIDKGYKRIRLHIIHWQEIKRTDRHNDARLPCIDTVHWSQAITNIQPHTEAHTTGRGPYHQHFTINFVALYWWVRPRRLARPDEHGSIMLVVVDAKAWFLSLHNSL